VSLCAGTDWQFAILASDKELFDSLSKQSSFDPTLVSQIAAPEHFADQ